MNNPQEALTSAIQWFPAENNQVSIWDHPNFKTRVVLPDDYFAITRVEQGLEMIQQGRINEDALTVLKVVGDAVCANENQLRRYLVRKMTFSQTSEHLKRLRKYGFVERHKCRLAFIEEEGEEFIRPPAPFTLGIAGYKLLNFLYSGKKFTHAEYWYEQPTAIQRYVSINEFRAQAAELRVLRDFVWNPYIGGLSKYKKPIAVAKVETHKGMLQFIFEKPQMAQNFVGYLKSKLETYRYLFGKDKYIKIDGFSADEQQVVCLHVSSLKMAKYIHESVRLHTFPFSILILVEEYINESGMHEAFFRANEIELKRIRMKFFSKEIHEANG